MPASIIPVTGLVLGPVGSISSSDFPLRTPRQVKSTDTKNINYGDPVVLNTDNTYSSVLQFITNGSTLAVSTPLGIAVENVKTNTSFAVGQPGQVGGLYTPGQMADVLTQGTINVKVNNGTPTAGGAVFVRKLVNGAIPAGLVGGFEAVADGTNTVAIPVTFMVWKTGILSADGIAQITILQRQLP